MSKKGVPSTKRPKQECLSENLVECGSFEESVTSKRSRKAVNPKSITQASDEPNEGKRMKENPGSSIDASKPLASTRPARSCRKPSEIRATCKSIKGTSVVAKKLKSYKVKLDGDTSTCWITGIAITNNGRILLVDRNNNTVKAFSASMELQSSLKFQLVDGKIFDITIINDEEAVLNTDWNDHLLVLDISDDQLRIRRKYQLPFPCKILTTCKLNDKLVAVTDKQAFRAVKMFDLLGTVYWSVSEDLVEGQCPYLYMYVAAYGDTETATVVVTDQEQNALLCLDGINGTITKKVQLKSKAPSGVTFDGDGNMYVCMSDTQAIVALNADMSEEKTILTRKNKLGGRPQAIAYDSNTRRLFVSYPSDFIDIFQLS